MFKKIFPSIYLMWFLHLMIVNNVFTLGLNLLTSFVYLSNMLAIGTLYITGTKLDEMF